jgi:hypothetical protein
MKINLECGVTVEVTDFEFTTTYGGLIEGVPNQEFNDEIIERAVRKQPFGPYRPQHLIPPVIDHSGGWPRLPSFILSAFLVNVFKQQHLVVVWLRDDFDDLTIPQVICDAVRTLPWLALAEHYED